MDDRICPDCDADLEVTGMRHHPTCPLVTGERNNMDEREKQIVELAFSNLEKTILSLKPKVITAWDPPLTMNEVAKLRRKLVYRVTRLS